MTSPITPNRPDRWKAMRLHAANDRLHAAASADELFEAIFEILSNFVGCEQAAIFLANGGMLSSAEPILRGMTIHQLRTNRFRDLLTDCIRFGDLTVSKQPAAEFSASVPSACIPLQAAGKVVGVLCLFQLLPQRKHFTTEDREIFRLLSLVAGGTLARYFDKDAKESRHQ